MQIFIKGYDMKQITKKDLLTLIENLDDDDVIVVKRDGGDYWGDYVDVPDIKIIEVNYNGGVEGKYLGHPGMYNNNNIPLQDGKKVLLIG
jgi:hypothetical protein